MCSRVSNITVYRIAFTLLLLWVSTTPVLAAPLQMSSFCESSLVETTKNIFTIIQLGGPLLGGVVALGSTVVLPTVRSSDRKREFKAARNQGVIWGVIIAPLGTEIVQLLLNSVVVGGTTCGF